MLDFGAFFLSESKNHKHFVRLAQLAEDLGFKYLGFIDSPYNFMDVYPVMTEVALGTARIEIGPFVTNPLTRHPSVTASSMATLGVISNGRAFLGYGRGDSAVKMLGWKPAPWIDYEKSIRDIRKWMGGEPVEVEGAPGPVVMPWAKGEATIPIDLAVFGPRGCRTAGQLADIAGCNCAELGTVEWVHGMAQAEAAKAGRDRLPFEVSIGIYVTDDKRKALDKLRWEPEEMTALIWQLMRTYPVETLPPSLVKGFEWLAGIDDWWDKMDWANHTKGAHVDKDVFTDDIVDRWTVCGTPQDCIDKIRELEKIGVTRFIGNLFDLSLEDIETQIRRIGEQVLPAFAPATPRTSSSAHVT